MADTKTATLIHLGTPQFVACGARTSGNSLRTRNVKHVTCTLCLRAHQARKEAR